jgi:hypothetical protein
MNLTETDQARLANLRSQNLQWLAVDPNSHYWDSTFLLRVIDRLIEDKK